MAVPLAALSAAIVPATALAQSYQCTMPRTVEAPRAERSGPMRLLPVTGYTLALGWSPEFCRGRERQRSVGLQCSGRNGVFGLVVHGLWPESGRSWPQWCPTRARPTARQIGKQLCVSPSARLIAHQWAKHGACMVRKPETYFTITNILRRSLRLPDLDRLSRRQPLTAGDIRSAFAAANPGWGAEMIGVKLNARGWLEELRLCYDARFRPAACDRRRFGALAQSPAKIWRGL